MKRKAPRQQRDSAGRRLCRMPGCGQLVGKGRRSYCSRKCSLEFEIAYFPSSSRRHLRNRDKGICAICGRDCYKFQRVMKWVQRFTNYKTARDICNELGFPGYVHAGEIWQVDHAKPVCEGGWGTGLENLRTLCSVCHRIETNKLLARLAQERDEIQNNPLPPSIRNL